MEKKERKNKESINNHQFNWFFEKENKKMIFKRTSGRNKDCSQK